MITTALSQNISISGYVIDAKTGETLIGASVYQQQSLQGVATNKFGHFALNTTIDSITIQCSYVGYKSITKEFDKDTVITFELHKGKTLSEITITPDKQAQRLRNMSRVTIPTEDLKMIPSITGEANILKAYQLMPGIQSGKEGYSGLLVRGGSHDQNLFLLDDLPLYNVVHLGGFYSSFDPSMVKDVALYKGDFPARYGGRVSSVVDVRNIDGNLNELHGEFVFSLLLSKLFIEGPIKKGKASYAISLRRSNLDLYTSLFNFISNSPSNAGFSFYDFNAKGNYILSPTDRLFVNIYQSNDKIFDNIPTQKSNTVENTSKYHIKWGNTGVSIRWYHIFNNSIFSNTTLAYSGYKYINKTNEKQHYLEDDKTYHSKSKFKTGINEYILKSDFEIPWHSQTLRAGASVSYKRFIPFSLSTAESINNADEDKKHTKETISSGDMSLYAEYDFTLFSHFTLNTGLHYNVYAVQNKTFHSLQPRIIADYQISPCLNLKASYTQMQQNMHLLSSSNPGLPNDLWLPATSYAKPLKSNQTSLGLYYNMNPNYEVGVEAYTKNLTDLVEYKEGALIFSPNKDLQDNIENNGKGEAKGFEFLFRKKGGRSTGWIAYTLSKSERQFDHLNNGKTFPFTYDRRHDISIVYNYHIRKDLTLSTTWVYQSGHAVTLPQGKYQVPHYTYVPTTYNKSSEIHIYTERNSYRMPNYHRLDLGLTYTKPKPKGTAIWSLTAYNIYNRQNAYYLYFKSIDNKLKLYQQSIFPLILNFGYTYKF